MNTQRTEGTRGPAPLTGSQDAIGRLPRPVLRRAGAPLAPDVRTLMESRFGHGFGDVRIHSYAEASASALALGARACTVGTDIVFSRGAMRPATNEGQRLIAHDLAHVARSGAPQGSAGPLGLDPAGSNEEVHAERTAGAVMAGRTIPHQPAAAAPNLVHRSLLGAGIGALVGGVGLGLLGGRPGPAGAVAGALIGGRGGLALGTGVEQGRARLCGGDFRRLRQLRPHPHHARRGGGQWCSWSGVGQLTPIHEMGHVWQYQNGGLAYIPSSLIPQAIAGARGLNPGVVYNWRQNVRMHIDWSDWNAAEQAACIEDYNVALWRINAGEPNMVDINDKPSDYQIVGLARPHIELVRSGLGAPGGPREARRAPAPEGTKP